MTFKPESAATTFSIAMLVALGPLSTDMYLPALPTMADQFAAGSAEIQLTLSLFLAGFAIAQIIYGPLSDRFGRKPVLLSGLVLFTLASLGCMMSEDVLSLIIFRFLQAVGGSAGPVLGRAMVRDIHGPDNAGRVLSQIASAMALAPAIAPIAGGFMVVYLGWESIFLFLTVFGFFGSLLLFSKIAESAPQEFRHPRSLAAILSDYRQLLKDRLYLGYTLTCTLSFSGLFAFISGSSFVIIEYYGISEQIYGLMFCLVVLGYISGTMSSSRLSSSKGFDFLVRLGALICMTAGLLMLLVALTEPRHVAATVVPMMLFMAGVGLVMPQSLAGALYHYPHIAGSASGLLGFIQMTCAGLVGIAVGHGYDGSPLPMSLAIAVTGLLTFICYWWLIKPGIR